MFQALAFKKPNIVWAFLFFLFVSPCQAGFYDEQVKPVGERAFDSQSQKILISGFAATSLASTQDSSVREQWRNHQKMSEGTAEMGDRYGTHLVGPLIALGQSYFDRDNGISHVRALAYSTLVTHLMKESFRRQRPDSGNHQSMPSGHTSSAFATATSLTYAYGWKAAAVTYPLATFVALSRISDDVHWFSDTVAGAFVGVWMGRASFYSNHSSSSKTDSMTLVPVLTSHSIGVSWEYFF